MRHFTPSSSLLAASLFMLAGWPLAAQEPVLVSPMRAQPRYVYSPNSIVVPACAFRPVGNPSAVRCTSSNLGDQLMSGSEGPVQALATLDDLPHGATVTAVWFFWKDDNGSCDSSGPLSCDARLRLRRIDYQTGLAENLAEVLSQGSGGVGSSVDNTVDLATVDRSKYFYSLGLELPRYGYVPIESGVVATLVRVYSAVVQYEPPQ